MASFEPLVGRRPAPYSRRVSAQTFDGVPFTIDIPTSKTVAVGGTAKILRGHVVHNDEAYVVAVKVFKTMLDDTEQLLLQRELQIARQVSMRHPLILAFIGTAFIGHETSIVSLYMKNGNLLQYLEANKDANRKELILQVAEAVVYLHTVEGLVHGDLKCANVLISDLGEALLADFGLSTFAEKSQSCATTATDIRKMYTVQFAAPEILLDEAGEPPRLRSKTCQSDVYAFGMLILEALTGKPPWFGSNEFAVMSRVLSGAVPWQPKDGVKASISHTWWDICTRCWSFDPISRPTMETVLADLRLYSELPFRHMSSSGKFGFNMSNTSSACMPCGRLFAVLTYSYRPMPQGGVDIYDIASGQLVAELESVSNDHPYIVAVSPNGRQIAAGGKYCYQWDVEFGTLQGQPVAFKGSALAYSPDASTIATVEGRYHLQFWDAMTGKSLGNLITHPGEMYFAVFSRDGTLIATVSRNELFLWDTASGKLVASGTCAGELCCARFLPNGAYLVSGSSDGRIRMWRARTLEVKFTMQHPIGKGPHSVLLAVSPSGKHVASARDGTVQIWDVESGEPVGVPMKCWDASYGDVSQSIEFSADGRRLVLHSGSKVRVDVWDICL